MNLLAHYAFRSVIPMVIFLHLYYSPYTKVEESFNIQAIHDLLNYGVPFNNAKARLVRSYDHVEFPGAVPRTFVGAVAVAGISTPFASFLSNPEQVQVLVRGVVGLFNAIALLAFQDAVSQSFGRVAGYWFIAFQASQFHVMYYASRTLPNMFAFGLSTLSLRYFMLSSFGPHARRAKRNRLALYILTLAGVIFRSELALLLATQSAWLLFARRVSLRKVIVPAGVTAMTLGLLTTVLIDSFFWQANDHPIPLWPEWIAFRYNALSGHSADWGTSPWHFYVTSAIPRLLLNPITPLCIPIALADRLNRRFSINILAPPLSFVALYSFLPHKEWRFVLYAIPPLTAIASAGASWIWVRRKKSIFPFHFLSLVLVAATLVSFGASLILLFISSLNYPGAHALIRLHELADVAVLANSGAETSNRALIRVHLGNLACQTGVTRFLQRPVPVPRGGSSDWKASPVWYYDKTEDAKRLASKEFWERFDYALVENPDALKGSWEILENIKGFAGIEVARDQGGLLDEIDMLSGDGSRTKGFTGWLVGRWRGIESWALKRRFTAGWWARIKMEPKIRIMRKVDS